MKNALLLFAVLFALPAAARGSVHLLDGPGLTLKGIESQTAPPPPPALSEQPENVNPTPPGDAPPPAEAPPLDDAVQDAPSLGPILGYMIAGGSIGVAGLVFLFYGVIFTALANSSGLGSSTLGIGIAFLVIGIAHVGGGVTLFILGNNKRQERQQWLNERNISRPGQLKPYLPLLAVNF